MQNVYNFFHCNIHLRLRVFLVSVILIGFPFLSAQAQCDPPTDLNLDDVDDVSAVISWGEIPGAIDYLAQYSLGVSVGGITQWIDLSSTGTTATINGLNPGASYRFRVRSNCASENSSFSQVLNFKTSGEPLCQVATGLMANDITDNSALISWDPVTNGVEYLLQYSVGVSVGGITEWQNAFTTNTSETIGNLSPGSNYWYRVLVICADDRSLISDFSPVNSFTTTGDATCEVPTGLEAGNLTDNSADISWTMVNNAVEYLLQYSVGVSVGGITEWQNMFTSNTSATIGNLSPGSNYRYRVLTICSEDRSLISDFSPVNEFQTTGEAACPTPTNLSANILPGNGAELTWSNVENALEYFVQYRVEGTASWNVEIVNSNNLILMDLDQSLTYQFRVLAVCSEDRAVVSDFSTPLSFSICGTLQVDLPDKTVYIGYNPTACTKLSADVSGGTSPYTYLWSTGETSVAIKVCPEVTSNYSVTVTDMNGCSFTKEATVEVVDITCTKDDDDKEDDNKDDDDDEDDDKDNDDDDDKDDDDKDDKDHQDKGNRKVLICHTTGNGKSVTLCVSVKAVKAHLKHGDKLGPCEDSDIQSEEEYDEPQSLVSKAYPNPFSRSTKITFNVNRATHVRVTVFNSQGEPVTVLFDKQAQAAKEYMVGFVSTDLESGIYFYRIVTGDGRIKTGRLMVNR